MAVRKQDELVFVSDKVHRATGDVVLVSAVAELVGDGRLSLAGLITHSAAAADAPEVYPTAFDDPSCLKLVLDWRGYA